MWQPDGSTPDLITLSFVVSTTLYETLCRMAIDEDSTATGVARRLLTEGAK
jgi:hypothetical protein